MQLLLNLHFSLTVVSVLALNLLTVDALDNGLGKTPPMGWNTWMTCGESTCGHDVCNEEEVKSTALAMAQNGMQQLGYNYVNLDDCWAASRNTTTKKLTWDTSRFPSGIPALIEWLHTRGFKFGLYTSAGNQTCSSGGRPIKVPGSKGHYDLDALTFATWGVDYVKLDWCGDIKKDLLAGRQAHIDFAHAMNTSGRAMYLEVVAGYFFTLGDVSTVANSWRFCEDHHDAWSSSTEAVLCRADLNVQAKGSPGGWAYMDFLLTGGQGCAPFTNTTGSHCPGQTDDEYRTTFALWSLTQSPLIVATDVRNLTAIMRETLLNKEAITLHQYTGSPPGKRLVSADLESTEVWGREMMPTTTTMTPTTTMNLMTDTTTKTNTNTTINTNTIANTNTNTNTNINTNTNTPTGGMETASTTSWMVALVNLATKEQNVTVKWSDIGLSLSATASVHSVWNQTFIANATGAFSMSVGPHGTQLLRISTTTTTTTTTLQM